MKDFMYDSMDYIIILLIIAIVGSVIFWRLDFLFNEENIASRLNVAERDEAIKESEAKELDSEKSTKDSVEEKVSKKDDELKVVDKEKTDDKSEKTISKEEKSETKKIETDNKLKENTKGEIILVEIPQGSDSKSIANILESSGAIKNADLFLEKCESTGLSTKLKAGKFNIEKGSSLEEVINTITK